MGRTLCHLFLVAGLCAIGLGCTTQKNAPSEVSGTVKYKGQLVKGGTVQFITSDNNVTTAYIQPDGTYTTGLPATGEVKVTVETDSAKPTMKEYVGPGGKKMKEYKPPGMPAGAGPDPANYVKIPDKYKDVKTSNLKTTLSTGKNTYNIELTD